MNKDQLTTGFVTSIVVMAALAFLATIINSKVGALTPGTYLLLGWVAGVAGLFAAGTIDN